MQTYRIINEDDPNDSFEVEAETDARAEALGVRFLRQGSFGDPGQTKDNQRGQDNFLQHGGRPFVVLAHGTGGKALRIISIYS